MALTIFISLIGVPVFILLLFFLLTTAGRIRRKLGFDDHFCQKCGTQLARLIWPQSFRLFVEHAANCPHCESNAPSNPSVKNVDGI